MPVRMHVPKPLEVALAACRTHFLVAAALSALINVLYLAPTIYMMQVYDRVVPTGGLLTLLYITIVVAVAIATLTALDAVRGRILVRTSLRLNRLIAPDILDRLIGRSKPDASAPSSAQAMREFDVIRQTIGGPAASALFDAPWTPIYFVVAFLIHPLLGGLVVLGGLVLVTLAVINERQSRANAAAAHQANGVAYASQEATFRQAELVRALGMRRVLVARHIRERGEGLRAGSATQFSSGRYNALVKFARMFMQSLALGAGAFLAVKGQISVGAIIAASVLLSRALQPIEQLVGQWPQIVQSRQALETLDRLFAGPATNGAPRVRLPDPLGHLELDRVVARAPNEGGFLLKNVSLKLVPGQILGVIGPSGAGKTTLARIAAGALAPDHGEVRIDGANVEDWDPDLLARHIGYLPQDSGLLPGTVGQNISRFADPTESPPGTLDAEIVKAARAAGVHDMILHFPKGYDTVLGGAEHRLSTGQAQRVALARALYGQPRVLILDEPNSALDGDGEEALTRAVASAKQQGAAIMIVAHRAAILARAETLLVMNEGMVARYGPREEVLAALSAAASAANIVPIKEGIRS